MAPPSKRVHDIRIAGMPLKLRSTHDPETVQELARMVDEKITEALRGTPSGSFQHSVLLASLNMAEELVMLRRRVAADLGRLEVQAKSILGELEDATPSA